MQNLFMIVLRTVVFEAKYGLLKIVHNNETSRNPIIGCNYLQVRRMFRITRNIELLLGYNA